MIHTRTFSDIHLPFFFLSFFIFAHQTTIKEANYMFASVTVYLGETRTDWEKRAGSWRRELQKKRSAEKTEANRKAPLPAIPPELRCPGWCRDFKSRNGVVPYHVSPIVASPEQEVKA